MTVGTLSGIAAALALGLAAPAVAQDSDAPIDVTAAPPPSAETIGPSQLRDFNLQGTVTRPSAQPVATPARPATTAAAPPRSGEAVPAEAAANPASGGTAPRAAAPRVRAETAAAQQPSSPDLAERPGPVTPSLPLEVTTNPAPQPDYADQSLEGSPLVPEDGGLSWPWLAALVALLVGGGIVAWNRRSRRDSQGDPGRMAFAGPIPDAIPEGRPSPPMRPRPDPVPPRGQPSPAPVPASAPAPAPRPADDGLIVSRRLKPKLEIEFHPERVVVTEQEAVLQFDMVITNVGSAPARNLLIEGRLFSAHAGQDHDIATFFENPKADGDRIASVAPLARISLKSMVRLPIDQLHHFEAAGRKLFVPMVGLNILYSSTAGPSAGDGQASASYLVGRGDEGAEKLAPFRLDLGPKIFRGLSSRPHSLGLQPAA